MPSFLSIIQLSNRSAFIDTFCDRIEAELYSHDFFDLDKEVTTVWDELIEENERTIRTPSSTYQQIS